MKRNIIFILLAMLSVFAFSNKKVEANGIPYSTYTYSSSKDSLIWTQDAYLPLSIQYDLAGVEIGNPQDITIDQNNNVYIADET